MNGMFRVIKEKLSGRLWIYLIIIFVLVITIAKLQAWISDKNSRLNTQINSNQQKTESIETQKKEETSNESQLTWIFYTDKNKGVSFKHPIAEEISTVQYVDTDSYQHEVLDMEGRLGDRYGFEITFDITDKKFGDVNDQLTKNKKRAREGVTLNKIINAHKYTLKEVNQYGSQEFAGNLIFERNLQTYTLKFSASGVGGSNKTSEEIFNQLVNSIYIRETLISQENYTQANGWFKYTLPQYNINISFPKNWLVWQSHDSDGTVYQITDMPFERHSNKYVPRWAYDENYNFIWIGHPRIFSTSGALCANSSCRRNDRLEEFVINIENNIYDVMTTGYRFQFQLEDLEYPRIPVEGGVYQIQVPYVTVEYAKHQDLSTVQQILSSIKYLNE